MPLFETLPIDEAAVKATVSDRWGLVIEKLVKASQNHTFLAHHEADESKKVFVRVTPDPTGVQKGKIDDELAFVRYLKTLAKLEGVCGPVAAKDGSLVVHTGDLHIVVFEAAEGEPVDFMGLKWLTDEVFVKAWGRWLATLHKASQHFVLDCPEVAGRMGRLGDIHDGLMQGWERPIAEGGKFYDEDFKAASIEGGEEGAIVLHGDCNISNFHWQPPAGRLWVFDWDQAHVGLREWDCAQCAIVVLMLQEGGMVGTKTPVPEADIKRFTSWFFAGYEEEGITIDRARFDRMLALRKAFYGAFATRAATEATTPDGMKGFLAYVNDWANAAAPAPASS